MPRYPALKSGAKLVRPAGAGFSGISFHRVAQRRVLTHTLKPSTPSRQKRACWGPRRCATQKQEQNGVFHGPPGKGGSHCISAVALIVASPADQIIISGMSIRPRCKQVEKASTTLGSKSEPPALTMVSLASNGDMALR